MTENNNDSLLAPTSIKEAEYSVKMTQMAFDRINQIVSEVRGYLTAERKGIPINVNKIKTEIRDKQQELVQKQRMNEILKKRAKQEKTKIAEWKQLYKETPDEQKEAEQEKIMSEIRRRSAEIQSIEEKIGKKLPDESEINMNIDFLNIKLNICQQEKFIGPIDKDPRMVELWNQQQEISDFLVKKRAELDTFKKNAEKQKKKSGSTDEDQRIKELKKQEKAVSDFVVKKRAELDTFKKNVEQHKKNFEAELNDLKKKLEQQKGRSK